MPQSKDSAGGASILPLEWSVPAGGFRQGLGESSGIDPHDPGVSMKPKPILTRAVPAAVAALTLSLLPSAGHAQVPDGSPTDLPVLSSEAPRGGGAIEAMEGSVPVPKTVDGRVDDWIGEPTRYGGTAVMSSGEFVYQDHLFDAHGPDDGRDTRRFETTDPLQNAVPEAYRIDALAQADPAGELGIPAPEDVSYDDSYGDATSHQDASDLHELRLAVSTETLSLLARTTTMTAATDTALLVLADTVAGSPSYSVPFDSGLTTSVADIAFFIVDGRVTVADLATGELSSTGKAQVDPSGWNNAIEASLPLSSVLNSEGDISIAAATGLPNASGDGFAHLSLETADDEPHANVANVAFRLDEPVRVWFEKEQALALHDGTIDPFFTDVDVDVLASGASQRFLPGPGYHDRIFVSDPSTGVPLERGRDGVMQHYGVALPSGYDGSPVPLQWWLHWRGGKAHTAGAVVPKVFKQFGEDRGTIVVSPSGRGTSTWYVGRGHVDIQEVWSDVFDTFAIDRDRVYVTGHSMGGWGSYLLTLLYPDRFAGAAPVAGPVTQGAWTGVDFDGCDDMAFDGNSPCYIEANDSRPRDQHTRKLLENALHVPYAILHGTSDELVPYSGVFRQAERLIELGYRHRLYTYPGYEHYSHPIADQWSEAAAYLHSFTRPENPAQVTYKRDMPFERATEEVQSGGATLNFDFDSAYWMSGLTPVDPIDGVAAFDGRSLALERSPHLVVPDSGAPTAPGQTGPYVITGLRWLDDPTASVPVAANGFDVDLSGASAVTLDVERMGLDNSETIEGPVGTEHDLDLGLAGGWFAAPDVYVDGTEIASTLEEDVVRFTVPAGEHTVTVVPGEVREEEPAPTNLALDVSGRGANDILTATLTETGTGEPIADRTIVFSRGGEELGSSLTDANGVAELAVKHKGKDRTYVATFTGDDSYDASSAESQGS